MKELLQPKRDKEHRLYERLRDGSDPHSAERREFFNAWWHEYAVFAPKGFRKKLQIEFHQRWWEMYLFVGLLHLGLTPKGSRTDTGPDVTLDIGGQQVFIEATAPSVGQASDRVPDPVQNAVADFPERECSLRLTQALTEKCGRLRAYMDTQLIPHEPCTIIALSASDLSQFGTLLEGVYPAPFAVLAGAGPLVVTIGGQRPPYSSRRSALKRDSGSDVDSALFENPTFSIVSGVLYSPVDLWNAPLQPEDCFSLFVNPSPVKPIPSDLQRRFVHWVRQMPAGNETVWKKTQPSLAPDG